MKKSTLIIIGITAILVLFGIWLYLLIYGAPRQVTDVFTTFTGLGTPTTDTTIIEVPEEPLPTVDVLTAKLRQLTTRPVIGFRDYQATTTEPKYIRYAEAGTGHIYQINLVTGAEERLSNTTIVNAATAVFSPNGKYAAIRSGYNNLSEVVLVEFGIGETATVSKLAPRMIDFAFSATNELLYSELTTEGITAKTLSPTTKVSRTVFTVPFQSATIVWSQDDITPHYVYPKATTKLQGYLYAIKNGRIERQIPSGLALTADANARFITFTTQSGSEPVSYIRTVASGSTTMSSIVFEPSKCVLGIKNSTLMYCGYEITSYGSEFPNSWYKGTRSLSDRIWQVDLETNLTRQIVSPLQAVGREIDIIDIALSVDEDALYFRNKNDNTLWQYEI
jgi:hypothetical protein